MKLDTTPVLREPEEAERIATELQEGDEDWTYLADHDPKGTGYSRVVVIDENGELVGYI